MVCSCRHSVIADNVTAIYKGSVKRGKGNLKIGLTNQSEALKGRLLHWNGLTLDLQKGFLKYFYKTFSTIKVTLSMNRFTCGI